MNIDKLGIVAGRGSLPTQIVTMHLKTGGRCYVACIESDTQIKLDPDAQYKQFKLGDIGAILQFFKTSGVKDIVFAGSINRPDLLSIKVDIIGAKLLARVISNKFLGDDSILRIVAEFCKEHGFNVLSPHDINLQTIVVDSIFTTKLKPSKQDLHDIEFGKIILQGLGSLDVGQAVIVERGYALGIEAAEGTDALIARCALLRKQTSGGVLIKMPKTSQDTRMDLPTIGVNTIKNLAHHKYNGLAIHKNNFTVVDHEQVLKVACDLGIFITSI